MSRPPSRLKQLFYSTLFAFLWIHAVFGQDQKSRLDVLRGNDGENSCILKSNLYEGCNLSPPSTFTTFETPASCTCNKVFFLPLVCVLYPIWGKLFPVSRIGCRSAPTVVLIPNRCSFSRRIRIIHGVCRFVRPTSLSIEWTTLDVSNDIVREIRGSVFDTKEVTEYSSLQSAAAIEAIRELDAVIKHVGTRGSY